MEVVNEIMQLLKPPPLTIDPKNPLENDLLQQKDQIVLLTKMLQTIEQPFVISIEAPWGYGKTKFVERWKLHLEKEGHACLYFNAWENDFVTDPLIAFIGELGPIVKSTAEGKDKDSPISKKLERLQKLGSELVKISVPTLTKAVATKMLGAEAVKDISATVAASSEGIGEILSEMVRKKIENYEKEKGSIEEFRKTLKELAENITSDQAKPKQIVLFIDELDRCRPDFAMTLLERIKHLFNADKVVFVLSIDREQLKNTVCYLYGSSPEHADIYLRRFIDLSYQLPKPKNERFAEMLYQRFQLKEFFQTRREGGTEHGRFLPAFVETATWLKLDLRTQEQCFTRLNAIARLWLANQFLPTDTLCILVGIKVGKPEWYDDFTIGKKPTGYGFHKGGPTDEFRQLVMTTVDAIFSDKETFNDKMKAAQEDWHRDRFSSKAGLSAPPGRFLYIGSARSELLRLIEFSSSISH